MVSRPIIKCGLGSVHKTLIDGGEKMYGVKNVSTHKGGGSGIRFKRVFTDFAGMAYQNF